MVCNCSICQGYFDSNFLCKHIHFIFDSLAFGEHIRDTLLLIIDFHGKVPVVGSILAVGLLELIYLAFKPRKMRLLCAIAITSKSPRHTRGPRTAWQAPTLQPIPHEAGKKPISVVKRYKISTQGRIKLWAPPESTITSELHKLIR